MEEYLQQRLIAVKRFHLGIYYSAKEQNSRKLKFHLVAHWDVNGHEEDILAPDHLWVQKVQRNLIELLKLQSQTDGISFISALPLSQNFGTKTQKQPLRWLYVPLVKNIISLPSSES